MSGHPRRLDRFRLPAGVWFGHLAAVTAGILIAATLRAFAAESDANSDLAVTVVAAEQKCFIESLQVTGALVPRNEILVRPDREGLQISDVLVEPGATVVAGQALARLTPPEGTNGNANVIVRAPAGGTISSVSAIIGTMASVRAEPLFRIVKDGQLELAAEAQGKALSRLAPNQAAKVEIIGAGEMSGRVRSSTAMINPLTQLGGVRVAVSNNPRLRVGAFGRAIIETGRSCGPAVPLSAVLYGQDGTFVQVVRDNRVETRSVTVGQIDEGKVEINEGLSEGDVVVARAGAFLKDGDRVRPMGSPTTSAEK